MSRCSYCYQEGHNRRTCPAYTERLQRSADAGSEYYKAMLEQRGKGKKKSDRTCSFCNTRGHDRRKCEHLAKYVAKRATLDMDARHDLASRLKKAGLGLGALVAYTRNEYVYETGRYVNVDMIGVVSEIRWSMMNHGSYDSTSHFITVEGIEKQQDGSYTSIKRPLCLPFDVIAKNIKDHKNELMDTSRWSRAPVIVSPVDKCTPPGTFFDRKLLERLIRDQAKDYKMWDWQVQDIIAEPAEDS